jgi:hypothetical protein
MKYWFALLWFLFSLRVNAQVKDSIKNVPKKVQAKMIPNPVRQKAILQLKNFEPGIVLIEIVDTYGTKVYQEKRLIAVKDEDEITLFLQMKNGAYWCFARQQQKVAKVMFTIGQ